VSHGNWMAQVTTISGEPLGVRRTGPSMTWIEHVDQAPWLVEHVIGTDGEHHGQRLGDINGDGRNDIVTPLAAGTRPGCTADRRVDVHAG